MPDSLKTLLRHHKADYENRKWFVFSILF